MGDDDGDIGFTGYLIFHPRGIDILCPGGYETRRARVAPRCDCTARPAPASSSRSWGRQGPAAAHRQVARPNQEQVVMRPQSPLASPADAIGSPSAALMPPTEAPLDLSRSRWQLSRRRSELSPACRARDPGKELLVGRRVRRAESVRAAERPAASFGQRLFQSQAQRGRVGRHRLRSRRAEGQGELDQTVPGQGMVSIFRFYGPTQKYFDKTWKLEDIVAVQ